MRLSSLALAGTILGLAAIGSILAEDKKEPEADGKKLSEWVRLLSSPEHIDRQAAVLALGKIGPEAAPALGTALGDRELINCRLWAAHALGKMGEKAKGCTPQLEATLKDESGLVRVAAARALWKISKHNSVVPALRDLLKDKDSNVRHSAVQALGQIGADAKAAAPDLVNCLKDTGCAESFRPDRTVERHPISEAAIKALLKVDPETAKKHGLK